MPGFPVDAMLHVPISRTIAPLIRRHAEDAAFYWSQHEASADSPTLRLPGLARFSHLLGAHLTGLAVAGPAAGPPCTAALARWKGPGEAFVYAYLALGGAGPDTLPEPALWEQVAARPAMLLRAVASALAWLPAPQADAAIHRLVGSAAPLHQVAGLRALALRNAGPAGLADYPSSRLLAHPDEHVRAAACRVAAPIPSPASSNDALMALLDDGAVAVRVEAAIAVGRLAIANGDDRALAAALAILEHSVLTQAARLPATTGWTRSQAARRLGRWVQHLAALRPPGPDTGPLLAHLPPEFALTLVAHHGDPAWLPFVVKCMENTATARQAGLVWQTVTGIDLEQAGLAVAEPQGDLSVEHAANANLVLPDARAVATFPLERMDAGQRFLAGAPLTSDRALAVCRDGTQVQRAIAARFLWLRLPGPGIAVRAPVPMQLQAMAAADSALARAERPELRQS